MKLCTFNIRLDCGCDGNNNFCFRKPLILKGVRQVGKTWILKEFGRRYYENTAYFNFDENEEYKQFFETTKDVDRILQNLMLASG